MSDRSVKADDSAAQSTNPQASLQPTTLAQASEAMLEGLELSPLTKRTYRWGLLALERFMASSAAAVSVRDEAVSDSPTAQEDDRTTAVLSAITEETLYQFSVWLREVYPDPRGTESSSATTTRTAKTYLVAAKRLMNWLDLHELLPEGVSFERMVRRIDQGKGRRRQGYRQRKADPDTIQVLSYYIEKPLPKKKGPRRLALLRNRALMAFLYDTGVRISEALALTRDDVVDGRAYKVRLTETKNGKPRTVFVSDETRRLVSLYCRERDDSHFAPLFASHGRGKGTAITPSHAWLLVKKAAQAQGLYGNTSPHSLRHRRAQDLLDEGMPLEWVAALLGHSHPDTTRVVYAWETDEERLGDMVRTFGLSPEQAREKAGPRWDDVPLDEEDETSPTR